MSATPTDPHHERRRLLPGSPLALQIAALMLGSLVVAQFVTLFLTLMLPPEPQPEYKMVDIAAALQGATVHPRGGRPLVRVVQDAPPGSRGPGWLTSPQSQHELAKRLGAQEGDVRLLFYTPLPFAGAATRAQHVAMLEVPRLKLAQMVDVTQLGMPQLPPSAPPAGLGTPGNRPADLAMPGRAMPGMPPPTDFQTGRGGPRFGHGRGPRDDARAGVPTVDLLPPGSVVLEGQIPLGQGLRPMRSFGQSTGQAAATTTTTADTGSFAAGAERSTEVSRELLQNGSTVAGTTPGRPPMLPSVATIPVVPFPKLPAVEAPPEVAPPPLAVYAPPAERPRPAPQVQVSAPEPRAIIATPEPVAAAPILAAPVATAQPRVETPAAPVAEDGPAPEPARGLFGLAPVPFVQGDFVAAMKLPNGRWAVVQPEPEPFPNAWQRRILLWFVLSFALVAPLGLMFARRLVKPLEGFADAAEQLGRDPRAPVMTLAGPAEIGRAARAFNQMQGRLRRFVDDRTAMIGAISHDLRTPLTRMRFRLEEAPDHVREGMLEEVAQMEEMITSVLHFIRDASEPSSRETTDMRSILASVVDGANLTGGDVVLEPGESAWVDIDALGMKRVLSNLVDNALKYGEAARIRLFRDGDDAVAEVIDEGPGLPDDELERVFQPFYRSPVTRPTETTGMGLGLAACRSITRAHGGDVKLRRASEGLVAEVRLPLATA